MSRSVSWCLAES